MKRLEKDGSPVAEEALRQITELYAVEKSVRARGPQTRLAVRRELADPIITAFRPWLEAQLSRIPRWSKRAEGICYTLARWPSLTRFLNDGCLEQGGAESWALLASLIANCKMCDVDPVSYLSDTLRALADGPSRNRNKNFIFRNFAAASSRAE